MPDEELRRYAPACKELDNGTPEARAEIESFRGFLAVTPQVQIDDLVKYYNQGIEADKDLLEYNGDPIFHHIITIEEFERKGTILSTLSKEEVVKISKEWRAANPPKYLKYAPSR